MGAHLHQRLPLRSCDGQHSVYGMFEVRASLLFLQTRATPASAAGTPPAVSRARTAARRWMPTFGALTTSSGVHPVQRSCRRTRPWRVVRARESVCAGGWTLAYAVRMRTAPPPCALTLSIWCPSSWSSHGQRSTNCAPSGRAGCALLALCFQTEDRNRRPPS